MLFVNDLRQSLCCNAPVKQFRKTPQQMKAVMSLKFNSTKGKNFFECSSNLFCGFCIILQHIYIIKRMSLLTTNYYSNCVSTILIAFTISWFGKPIWYWKSNCRRSFSISKKSFSCALEKTLWHFPLHIDLSKQF